MNLEIGKRYIIGKDPVPRQLLRFVWKERTGVRAVFDKDGIEHSTKLHMVTLREDRRK